LKKYQTQRDRLVAFLPPARKFTFYYRASPRPPHATTTAPSSGAAPLPMVLWRACSG